MKRPFFLFLVVSVVLLFRLPVLGAWLALNQAMVMVVKGQTARPLLEMATRWDQTNERAWWNLGVVLDQLGNSEAAVRAWSQIDNNERILLERGQITGIHQGDWGAALHWFEYALQLSPNSAQAYHAIGDARMGLKNWAGAREAYAQALQFAPENADYYVDYSNALLVDDYDLELAASLLEKAVILSPDSEHTYRALASLATKQGNMPEAIHWWEQAAAVPGSSVDTLFHLAEIYRQADLSDWALLVYQQAVEKAPDSPSARLQLAKALFNAKEWDRAIHEAQQSLKHDPTNLEAWLLLSHARFMVGDYEQACQAISQVLIVDPNNYEANELLSKVDQC